VPVFFRYGMGSHEGRHHVEIGFFTHLVDDTEHFQFGFRIEAISAFDLDRRGSMGYRRLRKFHRGRKQFFLGGGPDPPDRREDTASLPQDLEVGDTLQPHCKLGFPQPLETEVGVGINEPRDQAAAPAIDFHVDIEAAGLFEDFLLRADFPYDPILCQDRAPGNCSNIPLFVACKGMARVDGRETTGFGE
jgi:hypothetical protein